MPAAHRPPADAFAFEALRRATIRLGALAAADRRALGMYEHFVARVPTARDLVALDFEALARLDDFRRPDHEGRCAAERLLAVARRVGADLARLASALVEAPPARRPPKRAAGSRPSGLVVEGRVLPLSLLTELSIGVVGKLAARPEDVASALLRAFEQHLASCESRAAAVLRGRLGFDAPAVTLLVLGEAHGVTRERVRQLEARELGLLSRSLPFAGEALPAWLHSSADGDLAVLARVLQGRFCDEAGHLRFLAACRGGGLAAPLRRMPGWERGRRGRFDDLFADTPAPVTEAQGLAFVATRYGLDAAQGRNLLDASAARGEIAVVDGTLRLRVARREVVLAHVLADERHREGRTWEELRPLVAAFKACAVTLPPVHALRARGVVRDGHGRLRHRRFIADAPEASADRQALVALRAVLARRGVPANLVEVHGEVARTSKVDFRRLRFLVHSRGAEFGIHETTEGSGMTVALGTKPSARPLVEVLADLLQRAPAPIETQALARVLQRSVRQVCGILRDDPEERGVRVAVGWWWTRERLGGSHVRRRLREVLEEDSRPCSPRFLAEALTAATGEAWHAEGALVAAAFLAEHGACEIVGPLICRRGSSEQTRRAADAVRRLGESGAAAAAAWRRARELVRLAPGEDVEAPRA